MIHLHSDLIAMADAIRILAPTRYEIAGREATVSEGPRHAERLRDRLARDLYAWLYVRPVEPEGRNGWSWIEYRDFLAALSAANRGQGAWESGWKVIQMREPGGLIVSSPGGLSFQATENEVQALGDVLASEQPCRVRLGKELRFMARGYYYALGDQEAEAGEAGRPLWRFSWNLRREGAARLIGATTEILNTAAVPFRLKVLRDPAAYLRADAGVLYIADGVARSIGPKVRDIHDEVKFYLRDPTTLLSLRLGRGLGLMVDAAPAESAGMLRCRLVARALWQSFQLGEQDRIARLRRLAAELQTAGLDPESPHLGAGASRGSVEALAGLFSTGSRVVSELPGSSSHDAPSGAPTPLDAALRIGRYLCHAACWNPAGRECNWVGRSHLEYQPDGTLEPAAAALGADLYAGSAGVALFLAQLYAVSGDEDCRRTALGAMARSIRVATEHPERLQALVSVYEGRLGLAFAAWPVGSVLGEHELVSCSRSFVPGIDEAMAQPHPLDLLGGNAGAIPALLVMGGPGHLALAVSLGEELCRVARRGERPIRGMSHGGSGLAVALLALWARTGDRGMLDAARGAFAAAEAAEGRSDRLPRERQACETAEARRFSDGRSWCRGAPGIALARLHAARLDREWSEAHRAAARAAGLASVARALDEAADHTRLDASPCHGLAGAIEAALIGGRDLGDPALTDHAQAAARSLIARHHPGADYPSGLLSGAVTPSLMIGLAGTGYGFLRLHDPGRVPSILVPGEGVPVD